MHTLRILERAPCFSELAELAANHHEKLDGSGYPRSLGGADLDLPMRVLAVADIYEALTADRPYRGPMPVAQALAIIDREVPERLDGAVRDALEIHLGRAPTAGNPGRLRSPTPAPAPAGRVARDRLITRRGRDASVAARSLVPRRSEHRRRRLGEVARAVGRADASG